MYHEVMMSLFPKLLLLMFIIMLLGSMFYLLDTLGRDEHTHPSMIENVDYIKIRGVCLQEIVFSVRGKSPSCTGSFGHLNAGDTVRITYFIGRLSKNVYITGINQ